MKKTVSIIMALLLTVLTALPAAAAPGKKLLLAENGQTGYRIVISETATEAEKNAARVLSGYLERISSAKFETVTDSTAPTDKEIVVGVTNRDGEIGIDRSGYGDDGVRILTSGDKLFLTGGEKSGAIYAVYTFLEDYLGCRWFTTELTVIPETVRMELPPIDYSYVPPFRLRQTYWSFSAASAEKSRCSTSRFLLPRLTSPTFLRSAALSSSTS